MTAIFAYVKDTTAFVAADTCRADPLGFFLPKIVNKVYFWSDHIVIAQTGAGRPLEQLMKMMNDTKLKTGDQSVTGLVNAFAQNRAACLTSSQNVSKIGQSSVPVRGTLIAACARDDLNQAQIVTFDFSNGRVDYNQGVSVVSGALLYADGSSPARYQQTALTEFNRLWQSGCGIPLDEWSVRCLGASIPTTSASGINFVDWPADLFIATAGPTNNGRQLFSSRALGIKILSKSIYIDQ